MSDTVKPSGPATPPSAMNCPPILLMTGGVLTGRELFTLSRKLVFAVFVPSLTVTVMVALPLAPDCGVTVTVLLLPDPPNTIPD